MTEREMESLIAKFPDDFFPNKQFVLVGRQGSLAGVGRFDLLFQDRFDTTILMELKARTLKYDDATQVANYRDELKRRGQKNVVMWLVAPLIPRSIRDFLDDKGIEYAEIHLAEFKTVADRHDYVIGSDVEPRAQNLALPPLNGPIRGNDKDTVLPSFEKAKRLLGGQWTVRDLAEALRLHKSNAQRRLKKWLANGIAKQVSVGKRGRNGSLAKYRFLETIPDELRASRKAQGSTVEQG